MRKTVLCSRIGPLLKGHLWGCIQVLFATAFVLLSTAAKAADSTAVDTSLYTQHPQKNAQAVRADVAPIIDGRLDDAVWLTAPVQTGFTQSDPDPGKPSSEKTEFRISYDDVRSKGFDANDLGFMSRNNRITAGAHLKFDMLEPYWFGRRSGFNLNAWHHRNLDGDELNRGINYNMWHRFKNDWGFSFGISGEADVRDDLATRGGPVMGRPGSSWGGLTCGRMIAAVSAAPSE